MIKTGSYAKLLLALALWACGPAAGFQADSKDSGKAKPGEPASGNMENRVLPPGYKIGAGDLLQINVWRELEASAAGVVVRPDGKISLPLVKEISVQGLTPPELEKMLADKLAQYIRNPDVTVTVREIHGRKVYLMGAVKKEGAILLLSDMTIMQLLAEAGGVTEYAKKKKIYILRTENGKQRKIMFDYTAAIKGEKIEQNVQVLPEDVIVVPQ
jgi:polysaccharide export outer membrane protein